LRGSAKFFQENPNRTKEIQANPRKKCLDLLGFAWIPSCELGLFNGLAQIRSKKIIRVNKNRLQHVICARPRPTGRFCPPPLVLIGDPCAHAESTITRLLIFSK
jgi:hypothetical protein